MSKKSVNERKSGGGGVRRRSTPLSEHIKVKGRLLPPLLNMGAPMTAVGWARDVIPEMLWLASIVINDYPDMGEHEKGLVAIDGLAESGYCLDGTISSFSLITAEHHSEARKLLTSAGALPDDFLNVLSCYSECPAGWLTEEWANKNSPRVADGMEYLKGLVLKMRDGRSSYAAQLRFVAIMRLAGDGRLLGAFPEDLLEGYPRDLSESQLGKAEAAIRSLFLALQAPTGMAIKETGWAESFWQQNARLSQCEYAALANPSDAGRIGGEVHEEPEDENQQVSTDDIQSGFLSAIKRLEKSLGDCQSSLKLDLFNPVADEVKMGLAARQMRLLRSFLERPEDWTDERMSHAIRPMIDTRILAAWLILKNDPDLYARYKDFGQGKIKLLKLHFEEHMGANGEDDESQEEYLRWLEGRVNRETDEEFQSISLRPNFVDCSIRQMAEDCGLRKMYDLVYSPLSGESHGDWGSLAERDLVRCSNPLHNYHRLGRFSPRDPLFSLRYIVSAIDIVSVTVQEIFGTYGFSTEDSFEDFEAELASAIETA